MDYMARRYGLHIAWDLFGRLFHVRNAVSHTLRAISTSSVMHKSADMNNVIVYPNVQWDNPGSERYIGKVEGELVVIKDGTFTLRTLIFWQVPRTQAAVNGNSIRCTTFSMQRHRTRCHTHTKAYSVLTRLFPTHDETTNHIQCSVTCATYRSVVSNGHDGKIRLLLRMLQSLTVASRIAPWWNTRKVQRYFTGFWGSHTDTSCTIFKPGYTLTNVRKLPKSCKRSYSVRNQKIW